MKGTPKLTSIYPNLSHGAKQTLAACDECGSVQVFRDEPTNRFPVTGYWTECRACRAWRMFYGIVFHVEEHGRVHAHAVNENRGYQQK